MRPRKPSSISLWCDLRFISEISALGLFTAAEPLRLWDISHADCNTDDPGSTSECAHTHTTILTSAAVTREMPIDGAHQADSTSEGIGVTDIHYVYDFREKFWLTWSDKLSRIGCFNSGQSCESRTVWQRWMLFACYPVNSMKGWRSCVQSSVNPWHLHCISC